MFEISKSTKPKVKDVFNAYLVEGATYDSKWELPMLPPASIVPARLASFEKLCEKDYDSFVHFYCHDYKFECLWKEPKNYLAKLKPYAGVIAPDYSLYRDMPLCMQLWNTYRSRALAFWFSQNGIPTIPNIRWGDERSWEFCFQGIAPHSIVAVGSHGCCKNVADTVHFTRGFEQLLLRLKPAKIILYGSLPKQVAALATLYRVPVIQFKSLFQTCRQREN